MSVPDWMSDSIHNPGDYSESIAADVAGVLTTLKDKLVTNGTWSLVSEVAGTNLRVKSPVKADSGCYLDILIAKIDADTLDFTIKGVAVSELTVRQGRIDIAAAGNTTVDYYWGDDYLVVISQRATPEVMQAYIVDPSGVGDDDISTSHRVCGQTYRSTAGTAAAGNIVAGSLYALDNSISAIETRLRSIGRSAAVANSGLIGPGGRLLHYPAITIVQIGTTYCQIGALPMCWMCDQGLAYGTVKQLPVDTGTLRAFVVLPLSTTTNDGVRLMIRKPSQDA